jgi:hypothetical protein
VRAPVHPAIRPLLRIEAELRRHDRTIRWSNLRELWDALALIREEIEQHTHVPSAEYLAGPTPGHEAQALVEAIARIAEGANPVRRFLAQGGQVTRFPDQVAHRGGPTAHPTHPKNSAR